VEKKESIKFRKSFASISGSRNFWSRPYSSPLRERTFFLKFGSYISGKTDRIIIRIFSHRCINGQVSHDYILWVIWWSEAGDMRCPSAIIVVVDLYKQTLLFTKYFRALKFIVNHCRIRFWKLVNKFIHPPRLSVSLLATSRKNFKFYQKCICVKSSHGTFHCQVFLWRVQCPVCCSSELVTCYEWFRRRDVYS